MYYKVSLQDYSYVCLLYDACERFAVGEPVGSPASMDTFAIGDFATLNPSKVAKSPIAKVSIRLLVLKISYPKRKL